MRRLTLGSAALLLSCSDPVPTIGHETETDTDGDGEASTGTGDTGESGGESSSEAGEESSSSEGGDIEPSADWCDRVVAGPGGEDAIVELSLAHAFVRLFGTEADFRIVDDALIDALEPAEALDALDLSGYDESLASVCILPAMRSAELSPARVEMDGTTAWVRPGAGDVVLPPETELVVLDLRDLPNVPELEGALAAAVAPALATAVPRPTRQLRRHTGHTDQAYSEYNVYTNQVVELTPASIEPSGGADLELVVVTGERLPAAAAELAGSLRLQRRAWLVGYDVRAEVAESHWSPIGEIGAAWRYTDLREWGTARWPATILPDVATDDPAQAVAARFPAGAPPEPAYDAGSRLDVVRYDMWFALREDALSLGAMRAVLLVAHGVVELFFPYFDIVGHETDTALVDLLGEMVPTDAGDRALMEARLRRFGSVLHDGHAFVYDYETAGPSGVIAARFEARDGYPVVRRTNHPGLEAGAAIVAIEGEPTLDWYAARYGLVSAASDGYRHDLVTRMLTEIDDPIELTVESSQGAVQTVLLDPESEAADEALGSAPIDRATGWLEDVGAPTVQYINLANTSDELLFAAVDDAIATSATGMIVDMRGYPTGDHYALAERLIPGTFESPRFEIPVRTGPDVLEIDAGSYPLEGVDAYAGPMVLLVGNHSVSAAENFSIMLVAADRATVVGQQSASTNGNISGIMLPSGYMLAFTSMRVLYPDGSTFHGVGIVPDVEVPFDPVAYAQGEDPELLVAIAELQP